MASLPFVWTFFQDIRACVLVSRYVLGQLVGILGYVLQEFPQVAKRARFKVTD